MSHQFVAIFCATIGTGRPLGLPAVSPAAEFVVAEFVAAAPVMHKTISGLTYSHCHPVGGRKCSHISFSPVQKKQRFCC